jgi:aminoglycoside 6'-N-acetyltransferase
MTEPDLPLVAAWLQRPHLARWWLEGSTLGDELVDCRRSVRGEQPTEVLLVLDSDETPIGWCQWYAYSEYPAEATTIGASLDEVGIDYAIGDPEAIGRGMGTALIAALVGYVRARHPHAGLVADPSAANVASRRVLEHNGFRLSDERDVSGIREAIYHLPPDG